MNLTLSRKFRSEVGVFSFLTNEVGQVAVTCEHAYSDGGSVWMPKIPNGAYTCVRGKHRLHGMTDDFEAFEVTGVRGHTGILFHVGNYNKDSDGCILMGRSFDVATDPTMVLHSRATFNAFMQLMDGVNSFTLNVTG